MIGRHLAHYKITAKLGAGGMGEVYRAEDRRLRRSIALKVLPEEFADSEERLERFRREAEMLAALDHPNIVTIHSVEEDQAVHFLTMQLIEGHALAELIPDEGLPIEMVLEIAAPLADALRAAHERGIIHRDLKPANVMVDSEGRVRILDFGLAKLKPASDVPDLSELETAAMTQAGAVLGTIPYMSPEQVQGLPVDHRTDIFSFGALLYEMLTGRRPFQGSSSAAIAGALIRDTPAAVSEIRPDVPQALVEILDGCLAKSPAERPESGELRDRLRELRFQHAVGQAAAPAPTARPRRWHVAKVAVVAFLLVAAAVFTWWSTHDGPDAAGQVVDSLVVLPLQNLSGDAAQDFFVDGMTEALITDLSKIGALKVISRSSAMRFRDSELPIAEIANQLDVEAVVEGSVVREGNRVSIRARLVQAATDSTLWSERFERDVTSILRLQGEIARAIAAGIQVTLTSQETELLFSARDVDPAAYEAVVKGRYHIHRFTPEDFQLARQYFETALQIDPTYAPAQLGISRVWAFAAQAGALPPEIAAPRAREAALRALELDPLSAEVQMGLAGQAAWHEWDWEKAEAGFRRAIELDPNLAEARIFYAHLLSILGRSEEAGRQAERALELDPLNPFFHALHGVQIMLAGKHEEAAETFRVTFEHSPGLGLGRTVYADLLRNDGRLVEALEQMKADFTARGDFEVAKALEERYPALGYEGTMRFAAQMLEARSTSTWVPPNVLIRLYDHAGDVEGALRWVQRGIEARDGAMPYLPRMARSPELQTDSRFLELIRVLNLPDLSRPKIR